MTYVFNEQVFGRIPLGESFVRETFATAFQTWADVADECGQSAPFSVQQASGTTATRKAEFLRDAVNESVIVVRTADEWAAEAGHDPNSLALTAVWFSTQTYEIRDVDMELNGGAGTFTDCTQQRCTSDDIDLQNTVTHEAGHVLGLGHSSVAGATMQAQARTGGETNKRALEQDDVEGYCALDLPAFECSGDNCKCPPPPIYGSSSSGGCSCSLPGRPDPVTWPKACLGLAILLSLVWRRR